MTVEEALATIDWTQFHDCGHPVQIFDGVKAPCAECDCPGTKTWIVVKYEGAKMITPTEISVSSFTQIRLRRSAYALNGVPRGLLWYKEE